MVVYAEDREHSYTQLACLESKLKLHQNCSLSFHNFVNNADPVPRLLGGSLDALHSFMTTKITRMEVISSRLPHRDLWHPRLIWDLQFMPPPPLCLRKRYSTMSAA